MKNVFKSLKGVKPDDTKTMHVPLVKDWGLYFMEHDGVENRLTVLDAFMDFWGSPDIETLSIDGKCHLGGTVFGREGVDDGDFIMSSPVKSLTHDVSCNLICAETESGSKYYIDADNYNPYMRQLICEFAENGTLLDESGCYVPNNKYGLF